MRNLLLTCLALSAPLLAAEPAPELNIDPHRVTVSGISSGALMAHQMHIAYSDMFSGAAILSGGPYGCADNSMMTAMGRCMNNTDKPLPVDEFVAQIRAYEADGQIAPTGNLADDRVWLFHGTEDSTISTLVHDSAGAVYTAFVPADQIQTVADVPAGHIFPADGQGQGCTEMVAPFVGDCGYDAAGELLQYLYPDLTPPQGDSAGQLLEVTLPGADDAELMDTAYLFVPEACANAETACALHLALHGCAQSAEAVGTDFIEQSGYLPWAAANDIVVAFPQVEKSMVAPLNPHGCWDWWGYTGDDYLQRSGAQMAALANWIGGMTD